MHLLTMFLLAVSSLTAVKCDSKDNKHFQEYLSFIKEHKHLGELGNYKDGKIEIVLEKNTVHKIEETQAKRYIRAGETPDEAHEHAKIGIVAKDKYWVWVRDAVIFPSGATGTFDRIIKTGSLADDINSSVAVLPVTGDGKIILNLMYRHAVRDWVLEIPRGKIEGNETILEAAKRELKEETGVIAGDFTLLGQITPDSGTVSSVVPCYIAKLEKKGSISQDYSEAIADVLELSVDTVKQGFADGYIEVDINHQKKRVMLRDGYLSYALLLAEQKKLL